MTESSRRVYTGTLYRGAYHYVIDHAQMVGHVRYNEKFYTAYPEGYSADFFPEQTDWRMFSDLHGQVMHTKELGFRAMRRVGLTPNQAFAPYVSENDAQLIPIVISHGALVYLRPKRVSPRRTIE